MNTIQTKGKTHWLAHSKLSCAAAAALAFSAFQGFAQPVSSQPEKDTASDAAHANVKFIFPANFKTQEIQTDGATIHVRVGGQGPAVVLLHGFADTGDMWAPMAAELAHDHRVVVPDLRGLGFSSHPAGGYDKKTQAADIRSVLTQLGIDHAAIVGHDIGATVAYAYAARYPDKTDRLVVMDAPIPAIPPWDELVRNPALWHFSFGGPDAERLVAGRERIYLDRFWDEFAGDPSKIDEATRVHYTAFYAQPGAMRSAFAQFLSIPKDAEDNKVSMMAKLTMPVLAIGAAKMFGANEAIVMRNAADNVTEVLIGNSGHWLMDEQPAATIAAVRNFLDRKTTTTKSLPAKQTAVASLAPTKQFLLTRRSPAYWRVTFNHPPLNIFGPETIPQLNEIITALETNEDVKVVVFDSEVAGFFMTHYDFLARPEDTTSLPPGPSGLGPFNDVLVRLSRAPVVSIASIRGRATGNGSELALACDMRFASREKAILSHFEVGAGVVPGGGPMARLPRLMGRGRALEVLLGADDIPGDLAELYGYVNRSLPDSDLDGFVESLATRIASFDKRAISETKRFVDVASLPPDYELAPEWDVCFASIVRPAAQERIKKLMEQGFHRPGDVEKRLGDYVGQLGNQVPLFSATAGANIRSVSDD